MNNFWQNLPGNGDGDKIVFIFICLIALAFMVVLLGVIKWLFKKDSYWYYWRYWNPFTFVFNKRFTGTWFVRFAFAFAFLYFSYDSFSNRHQDTFGVEDAIGESLFLLMFFLMYGLCTWVIAKEDDSESIVVIEEAKRRRDKKKF